MTRATDAHYTIISADCHAGANHETYRDYLDPQYRDEFDAWRAKYKNPWRDLRDTSLRVRNWDDDRRNAEQQADGVVGEVVFPNTVPPFFPSFAISAPPPSPDDYERRRAGVQAHNRWLVDFCDRHPERRAGIGQIFLNDVDDAIEDATWITEHGLRGGVLLPNAPPASRWVKPLFDPDFDRLWAALQDLDVPVNAHSGTGTPHYGPFPSVPIITIAEVGFYAKRPFVHLLLSGVFERFPRLKLVITEMGAAWVPPMLDWLDRIIENVRDGAIGEVKFTEENALTRSATEYFHQNCWIAASQPGPADAVARTAIGVDRFMWGSDYPHDEGTGPFTREHLRQVFHDVPPDELRPMLAGNAAAVYGFDLDRLAPLAEQYGPTVEEIAQPLTELPDHPNTALLKAQPGSRLLL